MQKIITLVLAAALIFTAFPLAGISAYAEEISGKCGDNLSYTIKDGTLTISGTGDMSNLEMEDAFAIKYKGLIENLVLEKGMTSISGSAFTLLKTQSEIIIPDTVKEIGTYAFAYTNVETVTIPVSVEEIGYHVFEGAPLKTVNYGGSKSQWDKITKSYGIFPDGTLIKFASGSAASETYKSEEEPPAASDIITGKCGENLTYTIQNGTLSIRGSGKMTDFESYDASGWNEHSYKIQKIVLESGMTNIGDYAFYCILAQSKIAIPNTVKEIGDYAFSGADFKSVTIPESVTKIGKFAFSIEKLSDIYYEGSKEQWDKIETGDLAITDGTVIHFASGLECSEIYDAGSETDKYYGGEEITGSCGENLTYTIKDGVLTISGTGAMREYGTDLTEWQTYLDLELVLEEGITGISDYSFAFMELKTESLVIPKSVKKIGEGAFYMNNFKSVTIPAGVTEIGADAFYSSELTDIYYEGSLEQWEQNNFSDAFAEGTTLHYNSSIG